METEEKTLGHPEYGSRITDFNKITLNDLKHITSCDYCAGEYAKTIENHSMIKAPHYLKEDILKKSASMHNQISHSVKKLQLIHYSMKIVLAMCGALILLNCFPAGTFHNKETGSMDGIIYKMNSHLRNFSDQILEKTDLWSLHKNQDNKNYREDLNYDKKEK